MQIQRKSVAMIMLLFIVLTSCHTKNEKDDSMRCVEVVTADVYKKATISTWLSKWVEK